MKTSDEFLEEFRMLKGHIILLKQYIQSEIDKQFDYVFKKIEKFEAEKKADRK